MITDIFERFPAAEGEPPTAGGEAPVEEEPAEGAMDDEEMADEEPAAMEEDAPQP